MSDRNNCGACGNRCRADQSCNAGTCGCSTGYRDCGGVCVETASDNGNCGACGNICSAGTTCVGGTCQCPAGSTVCNGVCVDLRYDAQNCGACGVVCPPSTPACNGVTRTCSAGCAPSQNRCGVSCVDLNFDHNNCGACGYACPAAPGGNVSACLVGFCKYGRACDGQPHMGDCDRNAGNGYETNLHTSNAHCGACGRACGAGTTCCFGECQPSGASCGPRC
jgi:hypothetical protein